MTRNEAIDLVLKYDGKCASKYVLGFCDYLEITEKEFWEVADKYRNRDLWQYSTESGWELKARVF
jgi:hypothetical protein